MLVTINIMIIGTLLLLLVAEEVRFRHANKRIAETRKTLMALAHQTLSPLATVKKYNAFLRAQEFGTSSIAQMEVYNKMEQAMQQAIVTFNRLLVASKIEEGSILSAQSVDLRTSIEAAVQSADALIAERKHSVRLNLGNKPIRMSIDPLILHGIFDEVVQNAAGYTKPGGSITITLKEKGKNYIVSVKDNGIGITNNEKKYIFESFFRGERAKEMAPGSGLGLGFARSFAQSVGGNVRFDPTQKKGSTFIVELPKPKGL